MGGVGPLPPALFDARRGIGSWDECLRTGSTPPTDRSFAARGGHARWHVSVTGNTGHLCDPLARVGAHGDPVQ